MGLGRGGGANRALLMAFRLLISLLNILFRTSRLMTFICWKLNNGLNSA